MTDAIDNANAAAAERDVPPTTEQSGQTDPPAPPARRRRRWGWAVWLALAASVVALRSRSRQTSDVVVFGTRAGYVQGLASHRGQVMLALSTLSLGPERSLTVERDAMPSAAFDPLYGQVYAWVDRRKDRLGFGFAQTQRGQGIGNATHVVLLAPHWALAVLLFLPVLGSARAVLRERRRARRGLCRRCGYDLRIEGGQPLGICPECGEPATARKAEPSPAGRGTAAAGAVANVTATLFLVGGVLLCATLAQPVAAGATWRSAPPPPPPPAIDSPSALDQRVPRRDVTRVAAADVVRWLADVTRTPIEVDWASLADCGVGPDTPLTVQGLGDSSLRGALEALFFDAMSHTPAVRADGGTVRVTMDDPLLTGEGPPVLRIHEVGDLLSGSGGERPFATSADWWHSRRDPPQNIFGPDLSKAEFVRREALDDLIRGVSEACLAASWKFSAQSALPGVGASGGFAFEWRGRLFLLQPEAVQRRAAQWFDARRAMDAAWQAARSER